MLATSCKAAMAEHNLEAWHGGWNAVADRYCRMTWHIPESRGSCLLRREDRMQSCKMASLARELVQAHEEAWRGAVSHKFLQECKAGTIGENQFDAWLVQVRCRKTTWRVGFRDGRAAPPPPLPPPPPIR